MQTPNAGNFFLRIRDKSGVRRLLCLEDGIDAFSRNDRLVFVCEDEGRILLTSVRSTDLNSRLPVQYLDVRRRRSGKPSDHRTTRQRQVMQGRPDSLRQAQDRVD